MKWRSVLRKLHAHKVEIDYYFLPDGLRCRLGDAVVITIFLLISFTFTTNSCHEAFSSGPTSHFFVQGCLSQRGKFITTYARNLPFKLLWESLEGVTSAHFFMKTNFQPITACAAWRHSPQLFFSSKTIFNQSQHFQPMQFPSMHWIKRSFIGNLTFWKFTILVI